MVKDKTKKEAKGVKKPKRSDKSDGNVLFRLLSRFSFGTAIFVALCVLVFANWRYDANYSATLDYMGVGASQYDEGKYEYMSNTISKYTSKLSEDGGIGGADIVALRTNLDNYFINLDGDNTVITCQMFNGYFTAETEFVFDANFALISNTNNFKGLSDYLDHFWNDFRERVFVRTTIESLIFTAALLAVLFVLKLLVSFIEKKKVEASKTAKVVDQAASETDALQTQNASEAGATSQV